MFVPITVIDERGALYSQGGDLSYVCLHVACSLGLSGLERSHPLMRVFSRNIDQGESKYHGAPWTGGRVSGCGMTDIS